MTATTHNLQLPGNPKARVRFEREFSAGAAIGCIPHCIDEFAVDSYICSCGWTSKPYYDGIDLAHKEWIAHIRTMGADI